MTAFDRSRYLFQPEKHYSGARLQQGRVLLDSDFNEEADLDDELERRVLLDVIGPVGSPDQGFSVALSTQDAPPVESVRINGGAPTRIVNFRIRPGTMYLGGLRFTLEAEEAVAFQRDGLQLTRFPTGERPGMAVLHGWEQAVSAIEDRELLETAIAGVDTSVRMRRMRRVEWFDVEPSDADGCARAWASVRAKLEAPNGSFDEATFELRSNGRLRIDFVPGPAADACAPCTPTASGRYLGAENQAIRVMLVSPDRYVWAFDDASPIYRVGVEARTEGVTVTMRTPPKDEAHWPLQNTVVELLPASAVLPNGELVADAIGVFARVEGSYDPATHTIRLAASVADALSAKVTRWDDAHPDAATLHAEDASRWYMRVWHRATDDAAADGTLPVGGSAPLGTTGLRPVFVAPGRPGDYWIVTARPETPTRLVPWDLHDAAGAPPHGPRHVYAPLALARFSRSGQDVFLEEAHDCRPRFRPLTRTKTCCTFTVGDGISSHGDFSTLQAAIDALPPSGGKICVLPGQYAHYVRIVGKRNVTLEGCGKKSVIATPPLEADDRITDRPIIHLEGVESFSMSGLSFVAESRVAVRLVDGVPSSNVRFSELTFVARPLRQDEAKTAIDIRWGEQITIERCDVFMDGSSMSDEAAVFVAGREIRVAENRIVTQGFDAERLYVSARPLREPHAWGGLQIGGGSVDVEVIRNRIDGGLGHGITLGSVTWVGVGGGGFRAGPGRGVVSRGDCSELVGLDAAVVVGTIGREAQQFYPVTEGDLEQIRIEGNTITNMAGNGISVLSVLLVARDGERLTVDMLSVRDVTIVHNRIERNAQRPSDRVRVHLLLQNPDTAQGVEYGQLQIPFLIFGGIVLADVEGAVIARNRIARNGADYRIPTCGVFILYAEDTDISENRIEHNGIRVPTDPNAAMVGRPREGGVLPGLRGGIVVFLAGAIFDPLRPSLLPSRLALRVHGNSVIQPEGRSLLVHAVGPVAVENNWLASFGNDDVSQHAVTGHAVHIVNLGTPQEGVLLPQMDIGAAFGEVPPVTYLLSRGALGIPGGATLFHGNQVLLDWQHKLAGRIAYHAVVVASLDDVRFADNQVALNVAGLDQNLNGLLATAAVSGTTVNASGNRIAEGAIDSVFSMYTMGLALNATVDNVSTHCTLVFGPGPRWIHAERNLVWLEPPVGCATVQEILANAAVAVASAIHSR
jgi:hypothetical protein